MNYFKAFAADQENSAIYACHSPEELQIADKVLWLDQGEVKDELLSKVVFKHLSQAATWFDSVTSIPSLNFTPLMTLPR